jgi:hypothetical protein
VGADDVLELVEQLDVATSALRKERYEVDRLHLSIAAMKQEMATAELATTEALACLAGKAFGMI